MYTCILISYEEKIYFEKFQNDKYRYM